MARHRPAGSQVCLQERPRHERRDRRPDPDRAHAGLDTLRAGPCPGGTRSVRRLGATGTLTVSSLARSLLPGTTRGSLGVDQLALDRAGYLAGSSRPHRRAHHAPGGRDRPAPREISAPAAHRSRATNSEVADVDRVHSPERVQSGPSLNSTCSRPRGRVLPCISRAAAAMRSEIDFWLSSTSMPPASSCSCQPGDPEARGPPGRCSSRWTWRSLSARPKRPPTGERTQNGADHRSIRAPGGIR